MSHIWSFNRDKRRQQAVFSPLTGSEPQFDPGRWNNKRKIRKTHNCYAYVLDIVNDSFNKKPQPGYHSGYLHMSDDDIRSCDKLMERVRADNPTVLKSSFDSRCPRGFRKGYAAVDTSENPDYHFYRLDDDATWSHKPGSTKARMENFDGKIIVRPDSARRESNSHNYNKSCGYFCFNPDATGISNRPKKALKTKRRKGRKGRVKRRGGRGGKKIKKKTSASNKRVRRIR